MEVARKTIENDYYFLRQVSDDVDLDKDNYMEYISKLKKYCQNNFVYAMAPVQIGIPKRLIYIKNTSTSMENNENFEYDEEHIMINPVILRQEGHARFLEACESCKDFVAEVDRPYKIEIEYYNINKVKIKEVLEGFEATVFSHEYDHLNGILHLDLANKILKMSYEERKQYRLNNPYKILAKDGEYNLSKKIDKDLNKRILSL